MRSIGVVDMSEAKNPLSAVFPLAVATGGGVGFIPLAPGTFGSLVGLMLFFPLSGLGVPVYLVVLAGLSLLGVWASGKAEQIFECPDDGRIVIDEVVGQLIALTPLVALGCLGTSIGSSPEQASGAGLWSTGFRGRFIFLLVTGFVAFRWLDIYKPGVIRWVERNISGGAGVMADDWVAGLFAAVLLAAATVALLSFGG